ncbi:hypothetical protein BSZ37_12735 [Rubrivirga marina]|uniref:SnoaL-like domain-containing protein n=2 Tax=Rubrivirga marina TaxID=1196024 RepID=A0A271J150_9BACT|nr:hypothetical protein BSZ37_12735 [Rubrivirga marina]
MTAPDPTTVTKRAVRSMEAGWNAPDCQAFAAPFAATADFVDIRGGHYRGRAEIARGHQGIFDSIYRGNLVSMAVADARAIGRNAVVARVTSTLEAPSGALGGRLASTMTLVLTRACRRWQIASAHNTLVSPSGGGRP